MSLKTNTKKFKALASLTVHLYYHEGTTFVRLKMKLLVHNDSPFILNETSLP